MTVEDFEKIIKDEVAKYLISDNNPRTLYSDVAIRPIDLVRINEKIDIANIQYHQLNVVDEPIGTRKLDSIYSILKNKNAIGENTHDSGISATDLHELFRKLSLNVYGVTKNRDLDKSNTIDSQETYLKFKEIFFFNFEKKFKGLLK